MLARGGIPLFSFSRWCWWLAIALPGRQPQSAECGVLAPRRLLRITPRSYPSTNGCLALVIAGLLSVAAFAPADAAEAGIVRGLVWEDIDGDGRVDPGEPPIQFDRPLSIASPEGMHRVSAQTNSSGRFEFPPMLPGRYRVNLPEVAGLTWVVVHPRRQLEGGIEVAVEVGGGAVEVNIGLIRVASLARFTGRATISGVEVDQPAVEALVNEKVCSFRSGLVPPGILSSRIYTIAVASNAVIPGCADELGAPITFRVNGQPAIEATRWQPASSFLLLTVGSAAAPVPARVGNGVLRQTTEHRERGLGSLAVLIVLTGRALTRRVRPRGVDERFGRRIGSDRRI